MFENAGATAVWKNGPFFRYLAEHYAYASHYFGVCHPSAPNYLALTSGKAWQCGSDGYSVYSTSNLGHLLQSAGLSWAGYMESMPTPCDTTNAYPYAVKHDPFVYYSDLVGNATLCDSHVLDLNAWNRSVANGTLPEFSFITPNMLHDGHDTNVPTSDAWLRGFLGPQLNSSWMRSSVVFVTYDEGFINGVPDPSGFNGTDGGHVYFSAIGPWVQQNYTYPLDAGHYNLLSTIEWLLGLPSAGHNDSPAFPPMTGLFRLPVPFAVEPSASPMIGAVPLNVSFRSTVTGGSPPYTYRWSFGEGNGSTLATPTHVYLDSGIYPVTIEQTDAANQTATGSLEVVVENATSPVRVQVAANRTLAVAPTNVTFTASVSGGTPPYQVRWYFGNGAPPATGPSVSERFPSPGNYSVAAAAIDARGSIGGNVVNVSLVRPLSVHLLLGSPTVRVGVAQNATAALTGGQPQGASFAWTLNGTLPVGTNSSKLVYVPRGNGTYQLAVTVRDPLGEVARDQANFTAFGGTGSPKIRPPPPTTPGAELPAEVTYALLGAAVVVVGLLGWAIYRRRSPPPGGPTVPGPSGSATEGAGPSPAPARTEAPPHPGEPPPPPGS